MILKAERTSLKSYVILTSEDAVKVSANVATIIAHPLSLIDKSLLYSTYFAVLVFLSLAVLHLARKYEERRLSMGAASWWSQDCQEQPCRH